MKRLVQLLTLILFVSIIATATSCIGSKLKKQLGHTKFEMANKIGEPSHILDISNGNQIHVYFYQDYSQNNYPSIVGFMYVNKNEKIYKVEKYKTRLPLDAFLQNLGFE
jgi:hypothetical protein